MIFIAQNDTKIVINRHSKSSISYFKLINNSTQKTYLFQFLEDVSDSAYFYKFEDMDFSLLEVGEYTLIAYDVMNNEIERTLLVYGDYEVEKKYYQKENNKIVYERD